jgi:hypothetical protein
VSVHRASASGETSVRMRLARVCCHTARHDLDLGDRHPIPAVPSARPVPRPPQRAGSGPAIPTVGQSKEIASCRVMLCLHQGPKPRFLFPTRRNLTVNDVGTRERRQRLKPESLTMHTGYA